MTYKFHLSSIALLASGIALSGCASKQAWSPELEDARQTYAEISAEPMVSALAAAELNRAKKQLDVAEDASAYFKGREVISHEATLAKLKTLEAQQVARTLTAKNNLQLARSGVMPTSPTMAAATPVTSFNSTSDTGSMHSGQMQGGHTGIETALSETQQIAQQLNALSTQILQVQARIQNGAISNLQNQAQVQQPQQQSGLISYTEQSTSEQAVIAEPQATAPVTVSSVTDYNAGTDYNTGTNYNVQYSDPQKDIAPQQTAEPTLGAAMAAPPSNTLQANNIEAKTFQVQAPVNASDARLREELRAMNARPSSRGMSLTLGERYFEAESARMWNGRAARHLDNIAAVMVENRDLSLDIEAHFDNSGTEESRNNLTQDRAIAVKSALVLRGVDAARINTAGLGDSAPIASNGTQLGRLQNRRVEIIFPNTAQ